MDKLKNNLANIQDKPSLLAFLTKAFNDCEKAENGCRNMAENFDGWREETKVAKIKVLSKLVRDQNKLNKKLILVLINYILGGSFSTDLAQTAIKLGARGEDVLKEMIRQKFNGKL